MTSTPEIHLTKRSQGLTVMQMLFRYQQTKPATEQFPNDLTDFGSRKEITKAGR